MGHSHRSSATAQRPSPLEIHHRHHRSTSPRAKLQAKDACPFRSFSPTKGTAHRRFAVSLNLNTGEYEGGLLWFPEFGRQQYAAPAGGAVVFSCSLLHEATPVTSGSRYVFLPFLYDDEAARIRQQNLQYLG